MADSDKTEPATAHRRREARDKGQVLKSMEVNTAVVLIGGFLALRFFTGPMLRELETLMRTNFSHLGELPFTEGDLMRYGLQLLLSIARMLLPIMAIISLAAISSNLLQVGFLQSWQVVRPQLSRLNPMAGFRRIFSYRALIELGKASFKIFIAGAVAYATIRSELSNMMLSADRTPVQTVQLTAFLAFRVGVRLAMAFGTIAAIDYFYQKWEYEKNLRMTRQEVKEELIRYEGRPEVRQRVRQIQRQMAMRRMMQDVPKADVILTNPTTYAIALQYNPKEMTAPKVVAKGARLIAQKIVQIAKEHKIPVMENKPLAQTLYKLVDIGESIPLHLYQAVADVLAYLWRMGKLKKKMF